MSARIEDVRYSRYTGDRRGRLWGIVALARWSALGALGARRSWRAKLIPVVLAVVALGPAIVVLGVRALFASRIDADLTQALPYREYVNLISVVILCFTAVLTPELLCPDRRDRVLDLYHSTAVSPRDYLTAKVGAAVGPMGIVTLLPVLVLFLGNVLFAVHPHGYLEAHWRDLYRIIGSGIEIAIYFGLVGLAISSLTARRAWAVGGLVGLLLISSATSVVLTEGLGASDTAELLALPVIPVHLARQMFPAVDDPFALSTGAWFAAYVVVVVVSLGILLARYRKAAQ